MSQNQRNLQIQVGIADKASAAFKGIASAASATAGKIKNAFSATIQGPSINTSKADKQVSQLLSKIRGWYRSLSETVVSASGIIAWGLGAVGAVGVQGFAEVSGGMTKLKASTGLTGKEFENLAKIAKTVYSEGFGDDFNAVSKTLSLVRNEAGDLTKDLKGTTEQALAYAKAFDADPVDVIKSVAAATRSLWGDFQENFNLITQARQQVGDVAWDFSDTITEYSLQVAKAGMSTKDFLNIMIGSSKAGAFNFDKPVDAVKEFAIRLEKGDQSARDAYATIKQTLNQPGRNFEAEFVSDDKEVRKKVMKDVIAGISLIKDKTKQAQVATGFFGTQFEDVGNGVIKSLQGVNNYLDETKQSAVELKNTFQLSDVQVASGVVRELKLIIEETIFTKENVASFMALVNDNKDSIKKGIEDIANAFVALAKFGAAVAPILTPIITGIAEFAGKHPQITAIAMGFALLAPQILAVVGIVGKLIPLVSGLAGAGAFWALLASGAMVVALLGGIIYFFEDISGWIDKVVAGFAKFFGVYDDFKSIKSDLDGWLFDKIKGSEFLSNVGQTEQVKPRNVSQQSQSNATVVNVNGPVISDNKNFLNNVNKTLNRATAQVNA